MFVHVRHTKDRNRCIFIASKQQHLGLGIVVGFGFGFTFSRCMHNRRRRIESNMCVRVFERVIFPEAWIGGFKPNLYLNYFINIIRRCEARRPTAPIKNLVLPSVSERGTCSVMRKREKRSRRKKKTPNWITNEIYRKKKHYYFFTRVAECLSSVVHQTLARYFCL